MATGIHGTHETYQTLQRQVLAIARMSGWERPAPSSPFHSPPGGAEVILCKPGRLGSTGRLLFAHLQPEGAPLTRAQQQWIAALSASIPGVEIFVWRPSDLPHIVETLTAARCYA